MKILLTKDNHSLSRKEKWTNEIIWFVSIYDLHLLTSIYLIIYMHLESVLIQKEYHAFATEQVQVITVGWR